MKALELTEALLGKYAGEWQLMGVDAVGAAVIKAQWSDDLVVVDCQEAEDRVFVTAVNTMDFGGPTRGLVTFREGYLKEPDGTAGARFMEIGGVTVLQTEVAAGLSVFPVEVGAQELKTLGLNPDLITSSRHLMVKLVEGDAEWVTRLSLLSSEVQGETKVSSLTTLRGYHRRIREVE